MATPGQTPGRRGTRRRADRSEEFVLAAMTVIRREGPAASMDQIAAEAGVSKPILYRHFTDRASLVAAVGRKAMNSVNEALERSMRGQGSPHQLVRSTIDTYLSFIEADPEIYRFLVHRPVVDAVDSGLIMNDYVRQTGEQVAAVLAEILRRCGRDTSSAEPWGFGIVGLVHAAGDWWMEGGPMTRTRLCDDLTSLLTEGLPDVGSAD